MVIRNAWRALRAAPGVNAFALLILTAAISAATITFSIVDAVVLRSLPFEDSDRLVIVGGNQHDIQSPADFSAWRDRSKHFTALAATKVGTIAHVPAGSSFEKVRVWETSASLFDVLRVHPVVGQFFTREHEGGPDRSAGGSSNAVAVISYRLWQRAYGGAPDVVGQSIRLANPREPDEVAGVAEIVGVAPNILKYPPDVEPELWLPLPGGLAPRSRGLTVIGRLRDEMTMAAAQAELQGLSASVAAAFNSETRRSELPTLVSFYDTLVVNVRDWMLLALCAAVLVMLAACANVANLMLSRSADRSVDLAVRAALGASPRQLAASLLTESLMLSLTAAALGILFAFLGLEAATAVLPGGIPRASDIAIDLRVMGVSVAAAVAASVIFGFAPAWHATRARSASLHNQVASTASSRHGRWRAAFVSAEVAVVSAAVVVSTLFVGSFVAVVRTDLGLARENVVAFRVEGYEGTTTPIVEALGATPGVVSVAQLVGTPPLMMRAYGGSEGHSQLRLTEGPSAGAAISLTMNAVTPGFFSIVGIPIVRGRTFTEADALEPVAIVDETVAGLLFSDGTPVGARVSLSASSTPVTVIGLARSVSPYGPEEGPVAQVYLPKATGSTDLSNYIVRTSGPVGSVIPAIRSSLQRALPVAVPVPAIHSLNDAFDKITSGRRSIANVMSVVGLVVLLIGAAGVYAVMSSAVALRRREMGIRVSLGATRGRIVRDVLARASAYVLAGLPFGFLGGWALSSLFASLLFGVRPTDASIYLVVTALLLAVGLVAALVPALRAARVDPIVALRNE